MKGYLYLWAVLLNPPTGAPEDALSEVVKWGLTVANSPDEVEPVIVPAVSPDDVDRAEMIVVPLGEAGKSALETDGIAARVGLEYHEGEKFFR